MKTSESDRPILLVEDNENDIALTLKAFEMQQIVNPVVVCRDGVEVIEIIKEWQSGRKAPVLILLDLKLPRIDGFQVLETIKSTEKFKEIPIIVLTSSKEERDIQKAYALGVNSYLVKPIEFEKFLYIAEQIKIYWTVLNISPTGLP